MSRGTLISITVIIVSLLTVSVILSAGIGHLRETDENRLHQVDMATHDYVTANGRFPDSHRWEEEIRQYWSVRDAGPFNVGVRTFPWQKKRRLAMNVALSGMDQNFVQSMDAKPPLYFDVVSSRKDTAIAPPSCLSTGFLCGDTHELIMADDGSSR